jgi:hypothetical protein
MKALNVISYVSFFAALVALPFLLVNWAIYMKRRPADSLAALQPPFPSKSVGFFLVSCVTAMIAAGVITTYARREALNFIQSLSGDYTVYVNEQQVRDSDKLISALKEIEPYWAHHSHPTKRIRVLIRNGERDLRLELGRDSDDPQEYWVFSLEPEVSLDNEIGRITTAAFDEY